MVGPQLPHALVQRHGGIAIPIVAMAGLVSANVADEVTSSDTKPMSHASFPSLISTSS
jgi:hypothetical protein